MQPKEGMGYSMSKGFTLVELLAVIVILALILAIAVPTISSLIENSKKTAMENNAKILLNSIRLKSLENTSFDPTLIDETNITSELNIDGSNIYSLNITKVDDVPYITIVGKNQWDNLTAEGTFNNLTIRNGLLLWLDAGNVDSYPGTGTSWYDLSGNDGTAIAYNNPVYNSEGYFNFDGATDFFRVTRSDLNGGTFAHKTLTVELWFRPGANGSAYHDSNNLITSEDAFEISIGNNLNGYSGIKYASTPWAWYGNTGNVLENNKWNLITFVHNMVGRKLYINGVEIYSSNHSGSISKGSSAHPYLTLMARGSGTGSPAEGDLAIVKLYSTPLTATEVLQNFNLSKARFGL